MGANVTRSLSPRERISLAAKALWRGLRAWCGDSAYERYLRAAGARGCAEPALSREEFYLEQLQRRFSRPNRCC